MSTGLPASIIQGAILVGVLNWVWAIAGVDDV